MYSSNVTTDKDEQDNHPSHQHQPSQKQEELSSSSSPNSEKSITTITCATTDNNAWWWRWMMRATSPSTAALLFYPSCGDDDDAENDNNEGATAAIPVLDANIQPRHQDSLLSSPIPFFCTTTTTMERSPITLAENSTQGDTSDIDETGNCHRLLQTSLATLMQNKIQFGQAIPATTYITKIQHVAQLTTWDCGVACMQMILAWLRNGIEGDTSWLRKGDTSFYGEMQLSEREWMLQTLGTTSIWTIDLVCLLEMSLSLLGQRLQQQQQHNEFQQSLDTIDDSSIRPTNHQRIASYLFISKTLGVNDTHFGLRYYQRAMHEDQVRVETLFRQARQNGWATLQYPHLPWGIVMDLISRPTCIAMVLVDNTILQGKGCGVSGMGIDNGSSNYAYQGHYVLLCGISRDAVHLQEAALFQEPTCCCPSFEDQVEEEDYCLALLNPGCLEPTMVFVMPRRLERAWRATGTDEDIVFIVKHA